LANVEICTDQGLHKESGGLSNESRTYKPYQ